MFCRYEILKSDLMSAISLSMLLNADYSIKDSSLGSDFVPLRKMQKQ